MKRTIASLALTSILVLAGACGHVADESRNVDVEPDRAPAAIAPRAAAQKKTAPTAVAKQAVTAEDPVAVKAPAAAAAHDEAPGDCGCKDEEEHADARSAKVEEVRLGDAPVRGDARAPVTIVAFSDFQCPFCARAEDTLRAVQDKYRGQVRIVFRSQPLPFHEHARLASRAALAAGEQGRFWEYHDALFAHQRELDRASLERYAEDLGLNLARFRAAMDADRTGTLVDADVAEATRLGVAGTPTFFVNGRRIIGAQPLAKFEAAVDEALADRR